MNADTKTTCIENMDISLEHQKTEMYGPTTFSRLSGFAKNLTVCISLTAAFGCNSGSSNKDSIEDEPVDEGPVDNEPIEVIGISLGEISGTVHAVMALDADMDGDLDIVATSTNKAFVYENVSLNNMPEFSAPTLYAEFYRESNYRILADLNSDGDLDAISTVNFNPYVVYEYNLGSSDQPEYNTSDLLTRNGCVGDWIGSDMSDDDNYTALVDIDGDNDFDLFIGEKGGDMVTTDIGFCENTGNATTPSFAKVATPNPFGLNAATGTNYITFGDMDNDGDFDAWLNTDLAGEPYTGNYVVYLNNGTAQSAVFNYVASESEGTHGFPVQGCQHPAFADFDRDGVLEGLCADGMDVKYLKNN